MLCSIAFLAALLPGCDTAAPVAVGYVEGDYVLVAPIDTARVEALTVERGQPVAVGAPLAELERRDAELSVARAEAGLARARAELADLMQGARPAEIEVAEAVVQSAEADASEARRELTRVRDLFDRGVATQSQLDVAQSRQETAEARLREARARLEVLRLPARPDRIAAARAAVAEASAALDSARWRLEQRGLVAPTDGVIADIYRHVGDLSGPQAPILSILPEGGVKLRFYVPESAYSALTLGDEVTYTCDGCAAGLTARISYLATSPEFTPPVIYSIDTRQKLVYLAEARPEPGASALKPGQIVDVQLPEAGE